jgi:hypothetical protein
MRYMESLANIVVYGHCAGNIVDYYYIVSYGYIVKE